MRKGTEYFLVAVQSLTDLPPSIGEAVQYYLADEGRSPIHAILVIPPQRHIAKRKTWRDYADFQWRKTLRWTLVFAETQLIIVAADQADDPTDTLVIPLEALVSINLTTILLYAYLELTWINAEYIETRRIEFNAVDEHTIQKQVNRVLTWIATTQTANQREECDPELAKAELNDRIHDLPFKFRNYLRSSLLPGEQVQTAIYQPARDRNYKLWRQILSPNRVLAFTNHHLIILEEDPTHDIVANYSIRTLYYPIQHIQQVDLEVHPEFDSLSYFILTAGTAKTDMEVRVPLEADAARLLKQTYSEMVTSSLS